jgi:hypothetical protein
MHHSLSTLHLFIPTHTHLRRDGIVLVLTDLVCNALLLIIQGVAHVVAVRFQLVTGVYTLLNQLVLICVLLSLAHLQKRKKSSIFINNVMHYSLLYVFRVLFPVVHTLLSSLLIYSYPLTHTHHALNLILRQTTLVGGDGDLLGLASSLILGRYLWEGEGEWVGGYE